jgi:hypothetical protein
VQVAQVHKMTPIIGIAYEPYGNNRFEQYKCCLYL